MLDYEGYQLTHARGPFPFTAAAFTCDAGACAQFAAGVGQGNCPAICCCFYQQYGGVPPELPMFDAWGNATGYRTSDGNWHCPNAGTSCQSAVSVCQGAGHVCNAAGECCSGTTCVSGSCQACGGEGQPCCSIGTPCQGSLACSGGICQGSSGGGPPPPPPGGTSPDMTSTIIAALAGVVLLGGLAYAASREA